MTAFRYWRIELDAWNGSGTSSFITLTQVKFFAGSNPWPNVNLTAANLPAPYVVTSSKEDGANSFLGWNLFSGNPGGTYNGQWKPGRNSGAQWVQVDMGAPLAFDSVLIKFLGNLGYYINEFRVLASSTGSFAGEEVVTFAGLYDDDAAATLWGSGTSPVSFLLGSGGITADLSIPVMVMAADFGGSASPSIPMMMLDAAALGPEVVTADLVLPMMTVAAVAIGTALVYADLFVPMVVLDAAAYDATGENSFSGVVPMMVLAADFGVTADLVLPMMTVAAVAIGTSLVYADLSIVVMTLDAAGVGSPYIVTADLSIPVMVMAADFGGSASLSVPMMAVGGLATVGAVISAGLALPMMTLDAAVLLQGRGWADLALPMLRPVPFATADLSVPMMALAASAVLVVTYTYEAYAVNLNHKEHPGIIPTDEVTRYTNFAFDKIVRFKGDYYGVAADGLYLLGGDTDDGAPIPWAWKTFEDDFQSPQKKTLLTAYFSGRIGSPMAVNLYVGEKGAQPYTYVSPRGPDVQNFRQVLGRGIKARYFALGAAGTGAFELDTLDFETLALSRRI